MSTILESQIDCYESSLGTVTAQGDIAREQLEEAIAVGVSLFETLFAQAQAQNSRPEFVPHEQMFEAAKAYHPRYERISAQFDRLHDIASAMLSKGLPVRGVEKLNTARFELQGILSITPQDLEKSYHDIRAGRTIPLAQVRDELRRRIHA